MKDVYIVGEDPVTQDIIKRLIADYTQHLRVLSNIPARGGQIKSMMRKFNDLSANYPVILLLDLDANDCAPQLKQQLLQQLQLNPDFIFNVAIEETESWLFADKQNFAAYLHINSSLLPNSKEMKMNGPHKVKEIYTEYKPSRMLTHDLALKSSDSNIRKQVGVADANEKCKGNEYNSVIEPFIKDMWNPEEARKASDSLDRMIKRLQDLDLKCK